MNVYNYNQQQRFPSSGSSELGPVGKFIAGAFIAVPVAMAAVALQMGIESLFAVFFGEISESLVGAAFPTVITATFEGAATATIGHWAFGRYKLDDSREARIRSFATAAITGAAVGLILSGFVVVVGGGGGDSGGGDPAADFFPVILAVACFTFALAILGSVIFTIVNRGLMSIGLHVAAEYAEDAGKRLVEKWAPDFIDERWSKFYTEKDDKGFALAKGFARGTKWLTTCKRSTSNAVARGVISGAVSGTAVFQLEAFAHMRNYGYFWQVFVELFGAFAGLFGGGLLLALLVAIFRYPLKLLLDIAIMAIVAAIALFALSMCRH